MHTKQSQLFSRSDWYSGKKSRNVPSGSRIYGQYKSVGGKHVTDRTVSANQREFFSPRGGIRTFGPARLLQTPNNSPLCLGWQGLPRSRPLFTLLYPGRLTDPAVRPPPCGGEEPGARGDVAIVPRMRRYGANCVSEIIRLCLSGTLEAATHPP